MPSPASPHFYQRLTWATLAALATGALAACLGGGGGSNSSGSTGRVDAQQSRLANTRYAPANQCMVLEHAQSGKAVLNNKGRWQATADNTSQGSPLFFKASALGEYLLYTPDEQLLTSTSNVGTTPLANADPLALWTLKVEGDSTVYPALPAAGQPATPPAIDAYRRFKDPLVRGERVVLANSNGQFLNVGPQGQLTMGTQPSAFRLRPSSGTACATFPEAQSNVEGDTFAGPALAGFADTHLHATSTTFLGGAKPGTPFHKFGVVHALHDCDRDHGPTGQRDVVGSLFTGDVDGHSTQGWPLFTDWPSRTATTHEATYWKWIERAWKAGLRLTVNFAVDNQTLCEIQRNVAGQPTRDCNEMQSARQQINVAWAMQDYIDAQYGGPGQGWWRIVTTPAQAREVIAQGKLAVLLGVEISNLLNCTVHYNPANRQEGFEETTGGPTGQFYGCAMTETGAPHEILTQLQELKALGVSNLFTIHEFDNAFGGSDIFEGLVLNLGTRENSGGVDTITKNLGMGAASGAQAPALAALEPNGLPTGEFWTTHTCPSIDDPEVGTVFPALGAEMTNLGPPPPACQYTGRGGRPGGTTACYPAGPQCNARTLTPIGLYTFGKVMELGFNFEIDHLGYTLKNQLLDLSAAQSPNYPTISGHGFSGLSLTQAKRIFATGGLVYPTYNDNADFIKLWKILRAAWRNSGSPHPFVMGFGSDTNGLSPQAAPRATIEPGKEINYPFTLFKGQGFDQQAAFAKAQPLAFDQPGSKAPNGQGRTWHVDIDGNAHYGMAADSIAELQLEAPPELLADLYGSALGYVQFWERTEAASRAVATNGLKVPQGLLRAAPRD